MHAYIYIRDDRKQQDMRFHAIFLTKGLPDSESLSLFCVLLFTKHVFIPSGAATYHSAVHVLDFYCLPVAMRLLHLQ